MMTNQKKISDGVDIAITIIDSYNNFFDNNETEYELEIKNGKCEILSITNVLDEDIPEEIILLKLVADITTLSSAIFENVNNCSEEFNTNIDENDYFYSNIKILNYKVTTDEEKYKSYLSKYDLQMTYFQFFEALKQFLIDISNENNYQHLNSVVLFLDNLIAGLNLISGLGIFIADNIQLYKNYNVKVTKKTITNEYYKETNPNLIKKNTESEKINNSSSLTSFWLGITSIFLYVIWVFPITAIVTGIYGLCSFNNNIHKKSSKSLAIIGLGLGILYLFAYIINCIELASTYSLL